MKGTLDPLTARKVRLYFVLRQLADDLDVSRMTIHRALEGDNTEIAEALYAAVEEAEARMPAKVVAKIDNLLQSP